MRNYLHAFDEYATNVRELPLELLAPELRSEVLAHRSDDGELGLRRLLEYADGGRPPRGAVIRSLRSSAQTTEPDWDDAA